VRRLFVTCVGCLSKVEGKEEEEGGGRREEGGGI